MKIAIDNYIYESIGIPFNNEDVTELLESHGIDSLRKLNSILEAIEDKNKKLDETVPDLEPTPEEKAESDKMNASADKAELPPEGDVGEAKPEPIEPAPEEPKPEEVAPVEPEEPVAEEPEAKPTPAPKPEPKKEEKPLRPETHPPAIPPKTQLEPEFEKPSEWLPSKKLSTLYNNFIDFFGEENIDDAGTVVGLEAPGLKHDSKYLQCDITADVQGKEDKPYRAWIKLRRKRNTQDWSFNNPCEVRCTCKAFAYYVANANVRNKSLAGSPAKGKVYRDENGTKRTLNFLLPAPKNNPASVPALCKHLALVSKKLLDNGMISEV